MVILDKNEHNLLMVCKGHTGLNSEVEIPKESYFNNYSQLYNYYNEVYYSGGEFTDKELQQFFVTLMGDLLFKFDPLLFKKAIYDGINSNPLIDKKYNVLENQFEQLRHYLCCRIEKTKYQTEDEAILNSGSLITEMQGCYPPSCIEIGNEKVLYYVSFEDMMYWDEIELKNKGKNMNEEQRKVKTLQDMFSTGKYKAYTARILFPERGWVLVEKPDFNCLSTHKWVLVHNHQSKFANEQIYNRNWEWFKYYRL